MSSFYLIRKYMRILIEYDDTTYVSDVMKEAESIFSLKPDTFVFVTDNQFMEQNNKINTYDVNGKEVTIYMLSHAQ